MNFLTTNDGTGGNSGSPVMNGKGEIIAELDIRPDLWFFDCHFPGDPVMPGCLGLDAMWQLVGFFLGGLVVHGGLQGWWIEPVLGNLAEIPLMLGATVLTAFNDNAAITFLATLVPGFSEGLKYVVVAGAVAGSSLAPAKLALRQHDW